MNGKRKKIDDVIEGETENKKLTIEDLPGVGEATASPSGRYGESISLAILFPAFAFLRYILKVAVCPTMLPPIGVIGSPKNTAGFADT